MIGYAAMCEQFHPTDLVRWSKQAEDAGFGGVMASDHFHPWTAQQGQAAFVKKQFESVYLTGDKYLKPANFLGACAFISNYRHWWKDPEPLYGLINYRQTGTWRDPTTPQPSNGRLETVKYWQPAANGGKGGYWSATYYVEIQRPRQAYCRIQDVFWKPSTYKKPACP